MWVLVQLCEKPAKYFSLWPESAKQNIILYCWFSFRNLVIVLMGVAVSGAQKVSVELVVVLLRYVLEIALVVVEMVVLVVVEMVLLVLMFWLWWWWKWWFWWWWSWMAGRRRPGAWRRLSPESNRRWWHSFRKGIEDKNENCRVYSVDSSILVFKVSIPLFMLHMFFWSQHYLLTVSFNQISNVCVNIYTLLSNPHINPEY